MIFVQSESKTMTPWTKGDTSAHTSHSGITGQVQNSALFVAQYHGFVNILVTYLLYTCIGDKFGIIVNELRVAVSVFL